MKLSGICIERPVFAVVLSLLIIVLGVVGFTYLELRYFPKITEKTASVSISYSGASPELMLNDVTIPVENALYDIDGLQRMSSTSSYGKSSISLTFAPDANMTDVMGQVRDNISGISDLPADISAPSISQGSVERPVLTIGVTDDKLSSAKIRDYVNQYISPVFRAIPGMGAVWIYGANNYALRIWLEPQKMAALSVTVSDVQNALNSNNISFSGGSVRGEYRNFTITSNTDLKTADEFKNIIIKD
ncbi:MAG: efflux RND transporter permease subunit, partial [Francisellaceae bacterium]